MNNAAFCIKSLYGTHLEVSSGHQKPFHFSGVESDANRSVRHPAFRRAQKGVMAVIKDRDVSMFCDVIGTSLGADTNVRYRYGFIAI